MQFEVEGPEMMSLRWKVSSEANYDYLRFFVDNTLIEEIHGEVDWVQVSHEMNEAKTYDVRIEYAKDFSVNGGLDAGFVDRIILVQADARPFLTSNRSQTGHRNEPFSYQITTTKPATFYSASNLPPGLSLETDTGEITGIPTTEGNWKSVITSTNASGSSEDTVSFLIVDPVSIPFSDSFESGDLQPGWVITGTNTFRTMATQAHGPHAGSWHVVMDSDRDQSHSRNEMTLYADIRGLFDVQLEFWMKEFADEPDGPPESPFQNGADFDGVAISSNGIDWYEVQPLRDDIDGTYSRYSIDIDDELSALGLEHSASFAIRFNHYDNYAAATDGFALDDVSLTATPGTTSEPDLSSESDWGDSDTDDLTGDSTPSFSGSSTPGAPITLRSSIDGAIGSGTADDGGNWQITASDLSGGTHEIRAEISNGTPSAPLSVEIDTSAPDVSLTRAIGQANPAQSGPVEFNAVFSEAVDGFIDTDVVTSGNAGSVAISGGPTDFLLSVTPTATEGFIDIEIPGGAARDSAGNLNTPSSSPDNRVELDSHGGSAGSSTHVPLVENHGSETGWLSPSDTDSFSFTIQDDQIVTVFTTSDIDSRAELRDASGTLRNNLDRDDDFGDAFNFEIRELLSAGTYTVAVTSPSTTGYYNFEIDTEDVGEVQPDLVFSGQGDGIYGTLTGQAISRVSRKGRPVRGTVTVQNDGTVRDTFLLSASRGNTDFRVRYSNPEDGNITAGFVSGPHVARNVDPQGAGYRIDVHVHPIRKRIMKRKRISARGGSKTRITYRKVRYSSIFQAESDLLDAKSDTGAIRVRTR
jgi:hypothetical protein